MITTNYVILNAT